MHIFAVSQNCIHFAPLCKDLNSAQNRVVISFLYKCLFLLGSQSKHKISGLLTLPDLQQPNTSTATPPAPSDGRNLSHSVASQLHGGYQGQQQGGYPHPPSHYPPPVTPSHPPAPASSTSSGHSPTKDPPPSADRPPMPTQVWPQTQFFSVSFL